MRRRGAERRGLVFRLLQLRHRRLGLLLLLRLMLRLRLWRLRLLGWLLDWLLGWLLGRLGERLLLWLGWLRRLFLLRRWRGRLGLDLGEVGGRRRRQVLAGRGQDALQLRRRGSGR